jgi:hypothetical protein
MTARLHPIPGQWPEAHAPTTLVQLIAELAAHGALVMWTSGGDGVEARTTIHLDGDVTTTITPQCMSHLQRDELLRRHGEAMLKVGALLRSGTARATRVTAVVAGTIAAVATAADIIAEHSWPHIFMTLGGVACVGMLVARLVRPLSAHFLIRSARSEIVATSIRRRTTKAPSVSSAGYPPTSTLL